MRAIQTTEELLYEYAAIRQDFDRGYGWIVGWIPSAHVLMRLFLNACVICSNDGSVVPSLRYLHSRDIRFCIILSGLLRYVARAQFGAIQLRFADGEILFFN